jgi:hypothetical protein
MIRHSIRRVLGLLLTIIAASLAPAPAARGLNYPWTYLVPENDSRDADMQSYDEFDSSQLALLMNDSENIFAHHMVWNKMPIKNLLSVLTPFCELSFDAVHPLMLTPTEKAVLREYFARGGFLLIFIDCYPYPQELFWKVKEWPLIDFLTKELPASSPDFSFTRITDAHPLFHEWYKTETVDSVKQELLDNPNTPNRLLISYRHHACAFVMGRYGFAGGDPWIPVPRPFEHIRSMEPKSYWLLVNIYVYAMGH